jgi:hypothetical protein
VVSLLDGYGHGEQASIKELHRALEQLLAANREFSVVQQREDVTSENYNEWRAEVERYIEAIITRRRYRLLIDICSQSSKVKL